MKSIGNRKKYFILFVTADFYKKFRYRSKILVWIEPYTNIRGVPSKNIECQKENSSKKINEHHGLLTDV